VRSPGLDGTADAARLALQRAGIGPADVDVAEFNESFAVTPLLLIRELGIDPERVNVHGGAVAVGHPLGASGGILLANALELLGRRGGRYGLLVIPAALGVSMALVVERLG
jgi:acetyl-CoA C-acetyltransferase